MYIKNGGICIVACCHQPHYRQTHPGECCHRITTDTHTPIIIIHLLHQHRIKWTISSSHSSSHYIKAAISSNLTLVPHIGDDEYSAISAASCVHTKAAVTPLLPPPHCLPPPSPLTHPNPSSQKSVHVGVYKSHEVALAQLNPEADNLCLKKTSEHPCFAVVYHNIFINPRAFIGNCHEY